MNNIHELFRRKNSELLSIYFTAGYPSLNSTGEIIETLAANGVDLIEVGIPFSDPMADGPVIQQSSEQAIRNGMNLSLLFQQLGSIRNPHAVPIILMGYLNPVLQYGMARFLDDCIRNHIAGVIIPDLPLEIFKEQYQVLFEKKGVPIIFLVTPQTPVHRVLEIDRLTDAFIYMVTMPGTTGKKSAFEKEHHQYFNAVKKLALKNPVLAGFGIHDQQGFNEVCGYVQGAIIGSRFIQAISGSTENIGQAIQQFIQSIRS